MAISIEWRGLKEFQSKLMGSILYEPEVEDGLDTIAARMVRGGKSKSYGKRNNTVTSTSSRLKREITTTLRDPRDVRASIPSFGRGTGRRPNPDFNPRVSGSSWEDYQENAVFNKMVGPVKRKIIKNIGARWSR